MKLEMKTLIKEYLFYVEKNINHPEFHRSPLTFIAASSIAMLCFILSFICVAGFVSFLFKMGN